MSEPKTYTVKVSAEFVRAFADWQRVRTLDADWVKVIPHDDGTAEVLLHNSPPPKP